jgi:hypothetical protein
MYKVLKTYTVARFEPKISGSVGGDDDHFTTPLGHQDFIYAYNTRAPETNPNLNNVFNCMCMGR